MQEIESNVKNELFTISAENCGAAQFIQGGVNGKQHPPCWFAICADECQWVLLCTKILEYEYSLAV